MAIISDDFERADGALGDNWIVDNGSWSIVSGNAEAGTVTVNNSARYATPLETINQYVEATVGGKGASNHGGVAARQSSATLTYYRLVYQNSEHATVGFAIHRVVSGSLSALALYPSIGYSGAQRIRIEVSGFDPVFISAYVNGIKLGTVRDSGPSKIQSGLYSAMSVNSNIGGRVADWQAGDFITTNFDSIRPGRLA